MEKEDYLETIYNLEKELGHIRISDIAQKLGLTKPSVTQMMQRLEKDNCIIYKPYLPLKLTEKGKKIGEKIAERHKVLADFFTLLGISKSIQEKDIHGIEHYLSPITLKKIKKLTRFLRTKKYIDNN